MSAAECFKNGPDQVAFGLALVWGLVDGEPGEVSGKRGFQGLDARVAERISFSHAAYGFCQEIRREKGTLAGLFNSQGYFLRAWRVSDRMACMVRRRHRPRRKIQDAQATMHDVSLFCLYNGAATVARFCLGILASRSAGECLVSSEAVA